MYATLFARIDLLLSIQLLPYLQVIRLLSASFHQIITFDGFFEGAPAVSALVPLYSQVAAESAEGKAGAARAGEARDAGGGGNYLIKVHLLKL